MKNNIKMMLMAIGLVISSSVYSFCGFYVAKADLSLINKKSEVIFVRDGTSSTITMSNDFSGNVKDFAMIVPVPVILKRNNIRIVNRSIFDKLGTYSTPRLVEYYDPAPCQQIQKISINRFQLSNTDKLRNESVLFATSVNKYKVTIEASYKVDEYDVLILSAKNSNGLQNWLLENGYKIPKNAQEVLKPYIKNKMKFFVVKVNLERKKRSNYQYLRPIQINFKSKKFMLPIRLGMANAAESQDLIVYTFTKTGSVESSNYRTVKIKTGQKIPTFVKSNFGRFYNDIFTRQYKYEGENAVFMEYAWNVTAHYKALSRRKCDPCVGPAPQNRDLSDMGVRWAKDQNFQVYFTRLHVRYTREKFPQDLFFIETHEKNNFQARYVITHPAHVTQDCDKAFEYYTKLKTRRRQELSNMQSLAGWNSQQYPNYELSGIRKLPKKIKKQNQDKNIIPLILDVKPKNPLLFFIMVISVAVVLLIIQRRKIPAL